MKKSLFKDSVREIKNTFKRFLSILAIVLLGVGFFSGIRDASPDMKDALDRYFDSQNAYDIQVISTLGLTNDDVDALKHINGVEEVEATYSFDASIISGDEDSVCKVKSLPNKINQLEIIEGKLPEEQDECVVDPVIIKNGDYKIGDYIEIIPEKIDFSGESDENNTSLVKNNKLKIVGIVKSPDYISRTRGTTKLGSGKISFYIYVPRSNINMEVYTSINIVVESAKNLDTSSNEYKSLVDSTKEAINKIVDERKQARYNEIVGKANKKLEDAQISFDSQKQDAENQINDAQSQINLAKEKLENSKNKLEKSRKLAKNKFYKADQEIKQAEKKVEDGKTEFASKKIEAEQEIAEYNLKLDNLKNVKEQYDDLSIKKETIENQINQIENSIKLLNPTTDADKIAVLQLNLASLKKEIIQVDVGINQIKTSLSLEGIDIKSIDLVINSIESGISLANSQLSSGKIQIQNAESQLDESKRKLENSKISTEKMLKEAENKIASGNEEIQKNQEKLDASKVELDEKLKEAQEKLNDAKTKISKIEKPKWYILGRDSNSGYAEYIQDTDRVAKLAEVFPVVFFVVAALVSLTSMSRMIEEQRVQIGTLKAMGYNKLQISMKYIVYSTFATVCGGLLGIFIGANFLPKIISSMYSMMYTLPEIICNLHLEIGLVGLGLALLCTIGATAYTCVKELLGMPAVLMLPKAPKAGKRIILEKIKFIWSRLKFEHFILTV